jgi:murein DD-endopeptidase MepM/ murein hydrolase activator NlpD
MKKLSITFAIILTMIFTACRPNTAEIDAGNQNFEELSPEPTFVPTNTVKAISPTPTKDLIQSICSPLEGLTLEELINDTTINTQDFQMPGPGLDNGHTGIDYAYYRRGDRIGIEGLPVYSIFPGEVATILDHKLPYGNTIIIETQLEDISEILINAISPPQLAPTIEPAPQMNCPPAEKQFQEDVSKRSIYVLYAHLKDTPGFNIGGKVGCGEKIGEVGNTGSSSNPHLHLETRIGPSGARFESMAYYTTAATPQEQYNYCVWRVSNLFQLFNPAKLLSADIGN